ncbi:hypothetical protein O4H53_17805 [Sulfitobacter sp. G21635-S1]|nr:hypothetical protein [Sulfitobacter sp. G21635-S1]MCZ4257409.1 hypothetical protein [Sulfitobacter sp. G21635-S1]
MLMLYDTGETAASPVHIAAASGGLSGHNGAARADGDTPCCATGADV